MSALPWEYSSRRPVYVKGDDVIYQLCGLWRKRVRVVSVERNLRGLDYIVSWESKTFPEGELVTRYARVAADFVEPCDA